MIGENITEPQEGPKETIAQRMQRLQKDLVDSGLVPIEDALRIKSEQQKRDAEAVLPPKRSVSEIRASVDEITERTISRAQTTASQEIDLQK